MSSHNKLTKYKLISNIIRGPVAPTINNGWQANKENIIPLMADTSKVSPTPIKFSV